MIPEIPFKVDIVKKKVGEEGKGKEEMFILDTLGVRKCLMGEEPVLKSIDRWREILYRALGN